MARRSKLCFVDSRTCADYYSYSDDTAALQDRTFIEEMKADILRRAEAASYEDDEEEDKDEFGLTIEKDLEGGVERITSRKVVMLPEAWERGVVERRGCQ